MPPPHAPRLAPGASVQHYEVIRRLGKGGMGTVYLARDTRLGRLVALKLLTKHTGEHAARFLREARATAQLVHENIVVIHELGEHEGTPYMVLEYLQGKTLEQMLRERREPAPEDPDADAPPEAKEAVGLPPGRAVELMIPVVRALACAHARGIVHRDLKPSNVFWTDMGVVKVLDFGLAKQVAVPEGSAFAEGDAPPSINVPGDETTGRWRMLGTPPYSSPEQWQGDRVDQHTDLWAAGLVLAELLLGRHPLAPLSPWATASIADLDVPMPSLRELRPDVGKLGSIIDRCLIKRVEDRMGSALELSAELEALVPAPRSVPPASEERHPFVGLTAFQLADAGRFFGRTAAVARVVARLADQPIVTIVGPSGAGKSSFVRAGAIPALERGGEPWEAIVLRPGSRPLAALEERLPAEEREGLASRLHAEPGLLGARLRALARRRLKRVLLFVDQFEELYTLAPEADRLAFLSALAGAADDAGSPLRVVLAIRSDFLDRLADSGAALPTLQRGLQLLPPMDRDGLREALVRPLEAVEHRFEPPELVEEMLDALPQTAAALPLLSFTAARLWEQRDRAQHALTAASYRRLGGLGGALSGHADAVLGAMSAEERGLARAALLRLVTPERTRTRAAMRELCELGPRAADMERVLGRLVDARLLSVEGSGEAEATVELVHESLIGAWPALSAWLSENQEDAAFVARLHDAARVWEAGGRSDDLLWRGQVLEAARLWRARYTGDLPQAKERFLRASIRHDARARRLRRWTTGGAIAVLSFVAVGVSLLAVLERREAARADQEAARADQEAVRAQEEARQARNATRMAAAREREADPTTALAILREVEPPDVPRGWAELSRWALGTRVARRVFLHPEAIDSAAWSPDGKRIVTASLDKTARVWSTDGTGKDIVLRGHEGRVYSAAWSPDGEHIVTASLDKTARVWSADGTGQPLVLRGHDDGVHSAAWSPDGEHIVTASFDRTARVWNADGTGKDLVLRGHEYEVYSAEWSPDGKHIVTTSRDKTARVWNADGTGQTTVLRGHEGEVTSAAWSPDGKHVVTASGDKTARVWNADGTGKETVLRGHEDRVYSAAWSPDGKHVVTASFDKTARVWSADGTGRDTVLRGHEDRVYSAAWSPDGKQIVTASFDKMARVWSADGAFQPLVLRGHEYEVSSAAWSPDGKRLVTASFDKTARVWSADGTGQPTILRGHEDTVSSAAWSPDGKRLVTASFDKTARVWSADGTGQPLVLRGHDDAVHSAAWSPDGLRIVTASGDKTARVWSADGTGKDTVLRGHEGEVTSAAWSPDGSRIATASLDKTARVWSADGTGQPLVLRGHDDVVRSVAWSPDGKHVVTASHDKTARVWSADGTGEPLILRGHEHWVISAGFSPDGKRIFTASQDKTVRVWNADGTGEPLILRGAAAAYNSAAWSPDGSRIAAPSDDHTVWVWSDLEQLRDASDPKLWTATSYCLPVDARIRILGDSDATATADQDACLRRVDAARAALP